MLLLLLPLWFLLSFLIVVLLLQLLSTNPVVNQFEHLRRLFFLISSLFSLLASLVASRPGKVRTLLQHSCAIDGAPHCLVLRRHSDPHPDVVFSYRNASASNECKPCCSAVGCLLQMQLLNLHVMFVVIVLLFNFLYNADESFKDMDPLASGRRSHTLAGTVHCW